MNYRKVCLSTFALLGSSLLTNALWEKVFSPWLDNILSWVNDLLNLYSSTYSNDVYRLAATHSVGQSTSASFFVILVVLTVGVSFFVVEAFCKANFNKSCLSIKLKYDMALVVCLVFLMQYLHQGTKANEARKIHLKTEYNFVLLRPYISEIEFYKLKADFIQIETKNDFDKFQLKLDSFAKKHSVTLYQQKQGS